MNLDESPEVFSFEYKMSFKEYIELAKKQENQENEDEVWTEHDEWMRKHAPILPPEVKLCWLCENKSVGKCEKCQKAICKVHRRICSYCQAVLCIIDSYDEYVGKSYCEDCSDD